MFIMSKRINLLIFFILFFTTKFTLAWPVWEQGIYINPKTMENTEYLSYLIERAKIVNINTFVVDFTYDSPLYRKNIQLIKNNNIKYIARIIMFPGGGTEDQIRSQEYWKRKYALAKRAIEIGAEEIQLDYVRYKASQPAAEENIEDVYQVISWFKHELNKQNIPLQIDVFGIATLFPAIYIGQDIARFAESINAVCPMLYPSHFEPYKKHAKAPYNIILTSLRSLHAQLNHKAQPKIYPYIELFNYRYPLTQSERQFYIYEELRAVVDGNANGWYAWSQTNKYDNLFALLAHPEYAENEFTELSAIEKTSLDIAQIINSDLQNLNERKVIASAK